MGVTTSSAMTLPQLFFKRERFRWVGALAFRAHVGAFRVCAFGVGARLFGLCARVFDVLARCSGAERLFVMRARLVYVPTRTFGAMECLLDVPPRLKGLRCALARRASAPPETIAPLCIQVSLNARRDPLDSSPGHVLSAIEPVYFERHVAYWYGGRWDYRAGGRWDHDSVPVTLRIHDMSHGGFLPW